MKPKFNTKDPDILGSLPALRRAAKRAKALAIATRTPFYVWQNGRVVNLNPNSKALANLGGPQPVAAPINQSIVVPIALTYESPRWIEVRRIPRTTYAVMISLAIVLVVSVLALHFIVVLISRGPPSRIVALYFVAILGTLPFIVSATARSTVRVFNDRIEVRVSVVGLAFWSRTISWAIVTRCDLYKNWQLIAPGIPRLRIPATKKFQLITSTTGWILVMADGSGVAILIQDGKGLLLGSDDPQKLLKAINDSREARPSPT